MSHRAGRASARSFVVSTIKGGLKPALFFLAWTGTAQLGSAQQPTIIWRVDASSPRVEVAGVPLETLQSAGSSALMVFAEQGGSGAALPPMAGSLQIAEGRLRFEPLFPLARGVRYRAEFRATSDAPPVVALFSLPADTSPSTTVVTRIYPSADVLPENQLKFYVHFSAPMARGAAYQQVHIRDAAGQVIDLAFLELEEELWDPPMKRLTLLIDPGRIKRGVKPLEDIGPVFEAGKEYSLTVESTWRDATGKPLRERFEKKFRVGTADRVPPDPKRWKVRAPAGATRDPLVVDFDESLDHALALRLLNVASADGKYLVGDETLENEERRWKFVPDDPWPRGAFRIIIATTIEDLAGNNIGKTFDVDLFEDVQRRIETQTVTVGFQVR